MKSGKLYLVSTPIGNLEDITLRAVRILKEVDLIACEDTRHSRKLLNHYEIKTKLISYHLHNENQRTEFLLRKLLDSKDVALISDAGTPVISDPGYRLVTQAIEKGIEVVPIPGPSSLLAALVVSGLPPDRFCFYGFLPRGEKRIKELAQKIALNTFTTVVFESPKRILKSLSSLTEILGDRRAALCREMTKINEEVLRGTLDDIYQNVRDRENIRGEMTLIIEGKEENTDKDLNKTLANIRNRLEELKNKSMTLKDAVKVVSKEQDAPRKEVYREALIIWSN